MKRYGNLWEKIIDIENLRQAHYHAKQDKEYYSEVKMVESNLDFYLNQIRESLINGTYVIRPEDYTVSIIHDKNKDRELRKLSYYPHRIIQWAIMLQVSKIFQDTFYYHTCASIPNRGGKRALELTYKYVNEYRMKYCLKIDIEKFYPNINHFILKGQLSHLFKDEKLINLLNQIIDSNPGEIGVPIGSYVSQFLANFYLNPIDYGLKEVFHVKCVVRYMDDIVIFSNDKKFLQSLLRKLEKYMKRHLKIRIKANKQIFPVASRGVDFVGYRFFPSYTLLRKGTANNIKQLSEIILQKKKNKQLLNRHEFCGMNSYIGWLKYCDSYRFKMKYIIPIIDKLIEYHRVVIHSNKSSAKLQRYKRKLKNNLNIGDIIELR